MFILSQFKGNTPSDMIVLCILSCACVIQAGSLKFRGIDFRSLWHNVKVSTSRRRDKGVETYFPWSSHTSNLKAGTLMLAILTGAWRYRVSARIGRPGVSTF